MPYRVEISPNKRAGCKGKECKGNVKIEKGDLRFGTWVKFQDHGSFHWRHWGCVTVQQIGNINEEVGGSENLGELDGFEELPEAYQDKMRKALDEGHVDDEDLIGDASMNRPGAKEAAKEAEKEAKKQQKEAEKQAKKAEKEAEKEAEKAKKQAQKSASAKKAKQEAEEEEPSADEHRANTKRKRKVKVEEEEPKTVEQIPAKRTKRNSTVAGIKHEEDLVPVATDTKKGKSKLAASKGDCAATIAARKPRKSASKAAPVDEEEEAEVKPTRKMTRSRK